jgi:hypothetical protein
MPAAKTSPRAESGRGVDFFAAAVDHGGAATEADPSTAMTQPDASSPAPPKQRLRWYQYSLRSLLILTLLVAIGLKLTVVWTKHRRMKIAQAWVEACLDQQYPDLNKTPESWDKMPVPAGCPAPLDTPERLIVLRLAATELESPRQRFVGLKLLLETEPAEGLPMLREVLDTERDAEVRAWGLRLLGLCRDKESVDRVFACLADKDARVRAAAADALGLIHCPAYRVPQHYPDVAILTSNPPIDAGWLIKTVFFKGKPGSGIIPLDRHLPNSVIELPESMRAALETMMLQGATSDERIAAARALVGWPPAHYRLRVAEWGVWINDGGQLKLVQSVLDEIPKFVHRTGNKAASLADRLVPGLVVSKPIVHLTADVPLAADVQVLIASGRPWFAFPRPDDFTLSFAGKMGGSGIDVFDKDRIPGLSEARQLPELNPTSEGYPWIAPPHRGYESPSGWSLVAEIGSLGLRWQSLIVSPQQQPWMKPPPVGRLGRYAWWERLRKVPSSWLSSQDESERFLYYDGPTQMNSPVSAGMTGDILQLVNLPVRGFAPHDGARAMEAGQGVDVTEFLVQDFKGPRARMQAVYIEVVGGQAVVKILPLPYSKSDVDLATVSPITGAAVSKRFLAMLTDYGLTAEEAAGLLDVWKRQFFETPGKRVLVIPRAWDYDAMCPLRVRPAPTELVRLAIVLTEL